MDAAERMELSYRQAKRLWRRYRKEGAAGLVHRSAGRISNRAKPKKLRAKVVRLILHRPLNHAITNSRNRQDADFSPTFGISFLRARMGRYVCVTSSSLICLKKLSSPLSSMASNVTPSIPGAPLLLFAIR